MNLMQQPLLSIIVTASLAIAFLAGKVIEHVSSRPQNKVVYEDGVPKSVTVEPKGIDLDIFTFITGLWAFLSFIWMMDQIGVFG